MAGSRRLSEKVGRVGSSVLFAPQFVGNLADIMGYRLRSSPAATRKSLDDPQPPTFQTASKLV
jgi:hypothetical protein